MMFYQNLVRQTAWQKTPLLSVLPTCANHFYLEFGLLKSLAFAAMRDHRFTFIFQRKYKDLI